MRGVRLRKENIQIGNEDALQKLFKEDRGQHYYIGELFAVSKNLIPNSQRDYFNENSTRIWFENECRRFFKELYDVYHNSSAANSSFKKIDDYQKKLEKHNKKIENHDYIDDAHITQVEHDLKNAETDAQKAKNTIDKLKNKSDSSEANVFFNRVIDRIEREYGKNINEQIQGNYSNVSGNISKATTKSPKRTDKLSRCNKQERKLLGRIFNIIMKSTDEKTAESIIKNIEDEFK